MAEIKTINLEVQSNLKDTENSVKSLKAQLREAQNEVAFLSDKFGATSKEAVEAAKRAAELKDKIGDAKNLTEAFNPDAKFKSLSASLTGVAGGFSAVTGAMGVLGVESKDTEQAILKVQSAMAIASGLQQVGESIDSFKQLKAVAVNAFNAIKGAIGSTGIGLLVVALGTIITYWDDISEAVSGATKETKAYDEVNKDVTSSLTKVYENLDTVKIAIEQAKKGVISKSQALKLYNEKLGEAFGKTDDLNVAEQRMAANTGKYVQAQIARATAQAFVAKAAEAAAKAASGEDMDLSWWQIAKSQILNMGITSGEVAKNVIENQKQITFYQKLAAKETEKANKLENEIDAKGINEKYDYREKKAKESKDKIKEIEKKDLKEIEKAEELQSLQVHEDDKFKIIQDGLEKKVQALKNNALAEIEIEKLTSQAKKEIREIEIQTAQDFFNLLSGLGEKNKSIQKAALIANSALSIAEIINNTNVGSSKEVATKGIFGLSTSTILYAKMGISIASVLAATAKGLSALGGGSAGGGGGAVSTPTVSAPAPSFNVVGSSGTNQLAQAIGKQSTQPVEAYVVASNVTSAQSLNRNIVTSATIG